jgi:hypothetical protein
MRSGGGTRAVLRAISQTLHCDLIVSTEGHFSAISVALSTPTRPADFGRPTASRVDIHFDNGLARSRDGRFVDLLDALVGSHAKAMLS